MLSTITVPADARPLSQAVVQIRLDHTPAAPELRAAGLTNRSTT
jgi:hypothetical protein